MDSVELASAVRAEIKRLRADQKIPTEVRVDQTTWNKIRHETTYGPYGPRKSVLFDGLPCVMSVGLKGPFRVRYVQMAK